MTRKKNNSADWDWSVYFDSVKNVPLRQTLAYGLKAVRESKDLQAIDLGCGAGEDTWHLLQAGFTVTAIDQSAEGLKRIRDKASGNASLHLIEGRFENVDFPVSTLINASYALPFCPSEVLNNIWNKVFKALEPGGVFCGHLFGLNDSWNGKVDDMSFVSAPTVDDMCQPYDVLYFKNKQYDGTDAAGRPKHWHVYDLVLRKPDF